MKKKINDLFMAFNDYHNAMYDEIVKIKNKPLRERLLDALSHVKRVNDNIMFEVEFNVNKEKREG